MISRSENADFMPSPAQAASTVGARRGHTVRCSVAGWMMTSNSWDVAHFVAEYGMHIAAYIYIWLNINSLALKQLN